MQRAVLLALAPATAGLLFLVAPLCAQESGSFKRVFFQDFRGHDLDEGQIRFEGPSAHEQARVEPGGLRITLPGKVVRPGATGVAPVQRFSGDCSITMSYELLRAEPKEGTVAGVSLYAMALTPTADSVLLARFNRSDGQVYTCQRALTNAEGKRQFITRSFPAATSTGKLRMVRRGQHVVLSVADDPAGTFRDLHQFDFCSEDLHLVRVAADNGSSDNVVDVRIRDLEVGEDSAALPGSLDGRATPPRRWWLYSAGGMVALLLGGGGLALWLRARQGRVRQPPGATMDRNR